MATSEEFDVIESYEKRYPNNQTPQELLKKEAEARKERISKVQADITAKYANYEKEELARMDAEAAKQLIEQEQARAQQLK